MRRELDFVRFKAMFPNVDGIDKNGKVTKVDPFMGGKNERKILLGEILDRLGPSYDHFEKVDGKTVKTEGKLKLLYNARDFSGRGTPVNADHPKSLMGGGCSRKVAWDFYYYLHHHHPHDEDLKKVDRSIFEGQRTFSERYGFHLGGDPRNNAGDGQPPEIGAHAEVEKDGFTEIGLVLECIEKPLHHSQKSTTFLGREASAEMLRDFRDSIGQNFQWIQLAGEAGQGKSRLAFEFATISRADGWHSGFLQTNELSLFADLCEEWLPEAPTLIVVDYVLGKEGHIQKLVRSFARSSQNFSNPVRLVLIERQRWDRGNLATIALSDDGTNDSSVRTSSEGLASWYLAMCERKHDGLDPDFTSTRFKSNDGVIELKWLAASDLVQIVRQIGGQHICAERYSDDDIQGLLQKIDQSGRPLYACLLGDSLRDGSSNPVTKDELLTQTLNRERQTRWRQRFRTEPPKLGIDQTCQKLAILASMLGGYDISSSLWPKEFGELTQTDCEEALALVDAPVGNGIQPISVIPPMQPDLLREWFALSSLAIKHHDFEQLIRFAWSANSEAMAAFLSRCVQDFLITLSLKNWLRVCQMIAGRSFTILGLNATRSRLACQAACASRRL